MHSRLLQRFLRSSTLRLLAFGLLAFLPAHAWAATFTVTNTADSGTGSLRAAVASAVTGDIINITTTGLVSEGSTLIISQGVTVNGPTTGTFTLDGGLNGYGVLSVSGTSAVTISHIVLQEGDSNSAGGGLSVASGASATLNACTITGNATTTTNGGGIYNLGTLALTNSTISGNSSSDAGGGIDNDGTLTLTNCSLSSNAASPNGTASSGGGLYNEGLGTATLVDTLISSNTASLNGGGIENSGSLLLANCVVSSNTTPGSGGGLDNQGSLAAAEIIGCSFDGNVGSAGSDISSASGTTYMTNAIFGESVVGSSGQTNLFAGYCDFVSGIPTGLATGNISAPPDFVRAAGTNNSSDIGDLHLQPTSPCLGQGTHGDAPSAGAPYIIPTTDFDGFTRPSTPAIGAYDATQANLVVNNTTDAGLASGSLGVNVTDATTLRATVGYADDYIGVAITFDPTVFATAQTIALSQGGLTLSSPMTITGRNGVSVNGGGGSIVFTIATQAGSSSVTLENLGITGGGPVYSFLFGYSGGGGVVVNSGANAILQGCTLYNNTTDGNGGGVSNLGTVTMTQCALSGNTASGIVGINGAEGGGFYNGGAATVSDCYFGQSITNGLVTGSGNTAGVGGGIVNDTGATLTMTDSVIAGNSAPGGAGGLYNVATATTNVTNCTFVGNSAGNSNTQAPGGGVEDGSASTDMFGDTTTVPAPINFLNCTFTGNTATNGGGAIYSYGGVVLVNDIFTGDTGSAGTGFDEVASYNYGGAVAYSCDFYPEAITSEDTTDDGGNKNGNPNFDTPYTTPTAVYDLRLGSGSAAIGEGTSSAAGLTAPMFDITGQSRPTPPSIGAFDVNAANGTGPSGTSGSGGTTPTATTTSTPTADPTSPTAGQSVALTATVTPSTATGTVTFTLTPQGGGTAITAMGTLNSGTATATLASGLTVGNYTVTASYGGDTNDSPSTSASSVDLIVNNAIVTPSATTTTLTSSANPSTGGNSVTFTATVAPTSGTGTPTGTVNFSVDSTTNPNLFFTHSSTLSGNQATYMIIDLPTGTYTVTAVYTGDSNDASSTSSTLTQTVNAATTTPIATTTSTPTVSPTSPDADTPFTLSATVTPASGTVTPTGTVTFGITPNVQPDYSFSATGTLDSNGVATVTSIPTDDLAYVVNGGLKPGTYTIFAQYSGDSGNQGSTSGMLTVTVGGSTTLTATTTTLSSSANPSTVGQAVTVTAAVAPSSGTGTPTGTVTFTVDGTAGSPVTLTNGSATYSSSALTQGSHSITVAYSGDSNYTSSTSSALTQTVNAASGTPPSVIHMFRPGLQMIALDETYSDFADALNGAIPPAYDTYNGSAYSLFNSASEAAPAPGKGFWVYLTGNTDVYDTGTSVTGTTSIALTQGWNLIGSPYSAPFPVASLQVKSAGSTYSLAQANQNLLAYTTLYTYPAGTPAGGNYTPVVLTDSLQPFTGYWLYAFRPCTLMMPLQQSAVKSVR